MIHRISTKIDDAQLELKLMKLLRHPNIIQLYEAIERPESGSQCIIMEYAPKGDLFDYISENGQLEESKAKKLFTQLVSAVEHMHSKNIVHRDIKPENLLLDANNNLKLTDFGLSTFCAPNSMLNNSCGSPLYSAPEIFRHEPYDGRAADVWAMGVVLFAMVTGEIPWYGYTLRDQVSSILRGEFQFPSYLSAECKHLIKSMLTVAPNKRITIQRIKRHPWVYKSGSMADLWMRSPEYTERTEKRMAQKMRPLAPKTVKDEKKSKSKRRSSPDLSATMSHKSVKLPILVK